MPWHPYRDGSTLGTGGSGDGRIIQDEEHPDGARVTLEAVSLPNRPAFAITCGVYGSMVYTCFFRSQTDAERFLEKMRSELEEILTALPEKGDPDAVAKLDEMTHLFGEFVERFDSITRSIMRSSDAANR